MTLILNYNKNQIDFIIANKVKKLLVKSMLDEKWNILGLACMNKFTHSHI